MLGHTPEDIKKIVSRYLRNGAQLRLNATRNGDMLRIEIHLLLDNESITSAAVTVPLNEQDN